VHVPAIQKRRATTQPKSGTLERGRCSLSLAEVILRSFLAGFFRSSRAERRAGGLCFCAAFRADQRLGCDIACAPPPLAPPSEGGERWEGGLSLACGGAFGSLAGTPFNPRSPPFAELVRVRFPLRSTVQARGRGGIDRRR
jgi:hypothetical protein